MKFASNTLKDPRLGRNVNTQHPQGRLITNIEKDEKEVQELFLSAFSTAAEETELNGEVRITEDAYGNDGGLLRSLVALVIGGNHHPGDLSAFHRKARSHADHKKAVSILMEG